MHGPPPPFPSSAAVRECRPPFFFFLVQLAKEIFLPIFAGSAPPLFWVPWTATKARFCLPRSIRSISFFCCRIAQRGPFLFRPRATPFFSPSSIPFHSAIVLRRVFFGRGFTFPLCRINISPFLSFPSPALSATLFCVYDFFVCVCYDRYTGPLRHRKGNPFLFLFLPGPLRFMFFSFLSLGRRYCFRLLAGESLFFVFSPLLGWGWSGSQDCAPFSSSRVCFLLCGGGRKAGFFSLFFFFADLERSS